MNAFFKAYLSILFSFLLPLTAFADCDGTCPPHLGEQSPTWKSKMRLTALRNLDQFLSWSVSEKLKIFPLVHPLQEQWIEKDIPEVRQFVEKYGYFSATRPIVSKVTPDEIDLDLVCCLLKALYEKDARGEYLEIASAEVLTKALAYRDLKVGQKIHIPIDNGGRVSYEPFIVDRVFDIWNGMPAFGLIPERKGVASILLFRGTDFSLASQRGWASLMSDLDMAGPGLSAFRNAQDKISEWLQKAAKLGKKARAIGFSLGGSLAAYTYIYENAWIADRGSIAVCAPGFADSVLEGWSLLPPERHQGFTTYVNAGDIISKVGKLFGTVYCLSTGTALKPLTAHTFLMSSEPKFLKALVDVNYANPDRAE